MNHNECILFIEAALLVYAVIGFMLMVCTTKRKWEEFFYWTCSICAGTLLFFLAFYQPILGVLFAAFQLRNGIKAYHYHIWAAGRYTALDFRAKLTLHMLRRLDPFWVPGKPAPLGSMREYIDYKAHLLSEKHARLCKRRDRYLEVIQKKEKKGRVEYGK